MELAGINTPSKVIIFAVVFVILVVISFVVIGALTPVIPAE